MRSSATGWQQQIGYVPQAIFLADDSTRRNVASGLEDRLIDDGKVRAALSRARLLEWVESLPLGLDSVVGELGSKMSVGQRQRLSIARALYRTPVLLMLDEATSAPDSDNETTVMGDVESLVGDVTVVIVSHRDRAVANCQFVYRVEGGAVVSMK